MSDDDWIISLLNTKHTVIDDVLGVAGELGIQIPDIPETQSTKPKPRESRSSGAPGASGTSGTSEIKNQGEKVK